MRFTQEQPLGIGAIPCIGRNLLEDRTKKKQRPKLQLAAMLVLLAMGSVAEAACTNTIGYTPDGKQSICQVCTDMNGNVTTVCF